jgi:hypothetical protein
MPPEHVRIGGPTPDTGDLFNLCFCCPCCCVVGGIKHAPSYLRGIFKKGGIHFNAAYLKDLRPVLSPRQAAYMLRGQS